MKNFKAFSSVKLIWVVMMIALLAGSIIIVRAKRFSTTALNHSMVRDAVRLAVDEELANESTLEATLTQWLDGAPTFATCLKNHAAQPKAVEQSSLRCKHMDLQPLPIFVASAIGSTMLLGTDETPSCFNSKGLALSFQATSEPCAAEGFSQVAFLCPDGQESCSEAAQMMVAYRLKFQWGEVIERNVVLNLGSGR